LCQAIICKIELIAGYLIPSLFYLAKMTSGQFAGWKIVLTCCCTQAQTRGNPISGLVTWPFCGQITRFWLFYFLFGLEKNVWPFGSILAFLSSDRIFTIF
jgi:hypothetical protein